MPRKLGGQGYVSVVFPAEVGYCKVPQAMGCEAVQWMGFFPVAVAVLLAQPCFFSNFPEALAHGPGGAERLRGGLAVAGRKGEEQVAPAG